MHHSLTLLGLATTFGTLSSAHTVFTNLFVNDVNQGDGTCVRMPKNSDTCTNPIAALDDATMACGRDGHIAVAFTCPAPAGAKLTFEFREWADFSQPGSIDSSHKGPMAVYVKSVSDFAASPAGDGWFKIWDEGFDSASGLFATEKLIANNGLLSVDLPSALPSGRYLVRTEIISLQNVTETTKGGKRHAAPLFDPQFYTGCAQIFVQGDVANTLTVPAESRVSIPGHVKAGDSGLTFNIYNEPLKLPYAVPGPKVFFPCTESSGNKKTSSSPSSPKSALVPLNVTEGGIPAGCLLKNANWCGFELKTYTTETGCWDASEDCYKQADACYKSAPPSGTRNCDLWTKSKCDVVRDACTAAKFAGPPKVTLTEIFVNDVPPAKIPAAANHGVVGTVVNITATTVTVSGSAKQEPAPVPLVQAETVAACGAASVSVAVAVASASLETGSVALLATASVAVASLATATGVVAAEIPATNTFGVLAATGTGPAVASGFHPTAAAATAVRAPLVTSGAEPRVRLPVWLRRRAVGGRR